MMLTMNAFLLLGKKPLATPKSPVHCLFWRREIHSQQAGSMARTLSSFLALLLGSESKGACGEPHSLETTL